VTHEPERPDRLDGQTSGAEQAALERSPEAQERLLAEAHEFLERYHAVPPGKQRRHTRDDRFSGAFGVTEDGEVDVVEEPPDER
jgi:hypothetical protein